MKRITCKRRITFIAALALLALAIGAGAALAGGGVDWTVTIRNPTPWKANVEAVFALANFSNPVDIPPGGTAVIHCGANCPMGLFGAIAVSGQVYDLQQTDMQGTWMDATLGGASCWNHRMRICSKPGKEGQLGYKFYSFCKD